MVFSETGLKGAAVIELQRWVDERGFFARAWCRREFEDNGLLSGLVQSNISFNLTAGTLRGMHYQSSPYEEEKLVRCTRGALYDVIVDLRQDSPTFKQWFGVELTEDNRRMLYVPKGFAHGFQTLADNTEVFYHVTEYYTPGAERGIRWDDPAIGICWPPSAVRVISDKDRSWPDYIPPAQPAVQRRS